MTIYKTQAGEKKSEKDPEVLTEVLTEPLTGLKDEVECEDGANMAPKLVRVTYFPRRHRTCVNLFLILTALMVLATSTIAAIFLYRHLSNKVVRGRCGVTYYDDFYHQQQLADAPMVEQSEIHEDFFEEEVEVSEVDEYERISVPKFDEVFSTIVGHDFEINLTAIVDPAHRYCYIMPLNRTQIALPRNLIDFLIKLKTGYYLPKASVVRERYRLVQPPLSDLTVLGPSIMRECYFFTTYRLEKYVSGVFKRSTDQVSHPMELFTSLGYYSLKEAGGHVFKIEVYREVEQPSSYKEEEENLVDSPL